MTAVVPVHLITVVFGRVVGGGDHHAGLASQMTNGKRKLRRGTQALKQVHPNAVGRKYFCSYPGKQRAVVARIVGDGHFGSTFTKGLVDVVGQALSGHADGIPVDAVGARTHDATQASGAKFQIGVEGLFAGRGIAFDQAGDLFSCGGVEGGFGPHLRTCLPGVFHDPVVFSCSVCRGVPNRWALQLVNADFQWFGWRPMV